MDEQTRSLLGIVAVLRAALILWAVIVVAVDVTGTTKINGAVAVTALSGLALWSVLSAWTVRNRPGLATSRAFVGTDVLIATMAAALDPVVYPGAHPQSFASAWPLSGAVVAGLVFGPGIGALAGVLIGSGGALSIAVVVERGLGGRILGALGTVVLLAVAGTLAGLVSERLRRAELTTARAQIREEVARKLHDGVLQTLAVIQRRSSDAELVELARDQEAELRSFIASPTGSSGDTGEGEAPERLSAALRSVLRQQEKLHGISCSLVVVDEPEHIGGPIVSALCGAVGEAVTNAAKHGGARAVTVFVDSESGAIICEVSDDGSGFDTVATSEGIGLTRSVRGRIADVGGSVDIHSTLGRGTRVRMVVPGVG